MFPAGDATNTTRNDLRPRPPVTQEDFGRPFEDNPVAPTESAGVPPQERQSIGALIWQPFRFMGQLLFGGLLNRLPGIMEKPEEYSDFLDIRSAGGAEIYFKIVATERRIVLAGRPDDLASFLNVFIGNSLEWGPAELAASIRGEARDQQAPGYHFGITEESRMTRHYNPNTKLYEVMIEPHGSDGDFLPVMQRFYGAMGIFEKKDEYEIERTLPFRPSLQQTIWTLDRLLGKVGFMRSGSFRNLLNLSIDGWDIESGLSVGRLLDVKGMDVGIRVDRAGDPTAFVIRIREGVRVLYGTKIIEHLWIGVPGRNGREIFWEAHGSAPIDMGKKSQVLRLIGRDIFRQDISHIPVSSGTAAAARDLAERGPGGPATPVGGGGAREEITRAEEAGADEAADEGTDETAEYNAGYEDEDTFEVSGLAYLGEFAFNPVPVF